VDVDELALPLIALGGVAVLFTMGWGAARYAGWFGVVVPAVVVLALGFGWEWQIDAGAILVAVAAVLLAGFAFGYARRRRAASGSSYWRMKP
jgi:O-antigen/teichoic acid export membrane protein